MLGVEAPMLGVEAQAMEALPSCSPSQDGLAPAPSHEAGSWMRGRRHPERRRSSVPYQAHCRNVLLIQLHAPWPTHEEAVPLEPAGQRSTDQEVVGQLPVLAAVVQVAVVPVHDFAESDLAADDVDLAVMGVDDARGSDAWRHRSFG